MFAFALRKTKDGRLVYSLSMWMRILCLVFSIVLFSGLVSALMDLGFSISYLFPTVLAVAMLLVAFYRDEWIFDAKKGCE